VSALWPAEGIHAALQSVQDLLPSNGFDREDPWRNQIQLVRAPAGDITASFGGIVLWEEMNVHGDRSRC